MVLDFTTPPSKTLYDCVCVYCENTNRHYLETPIIKSTADACGIENIRKSDINLPNLI